MSVFGASVVKEHSLSSSLSSTALTNSLRESVVRKVRLEKAQFEIGRRSNEADQEYEQLVNDKNDAALELVRTRDGKYFISCYFIKKPHILEEDVARETLADKVELCDIYRALKDKAEMHGIETLPQVDQDTLNNRSLETLEKVAAGCRVLKITKASNKVSAQKLVEYATEALRKYSAKPGKNRVCLMTFKIL